MSKQNKDDKYKNNPLSEEEIKRLEEIGREAQKAAERMKSVIDASGIGKLQEQIKNINEHFKIPENAYRNIKEAITAQQEWIKTINQLGGIDMDNKIESITPPPRELTGEEFQEFRTDFKEETKEITKVLKKLKKERKEDSKKSARLSRIAIYIAVGVFILSVLTYFIFYV